MKRGIVTLIVALGFASQAHAAPGDPRLVQGVLEWPAKLTVEPFVVIRADDGRWYYTEIKGAKRLESGPLTAGGRVAVLGTEAARPHEITAIAVGSGDAAALALALMPHVNAPVAGAPTPPPAVEAPTPPKPVVTEPASTPKTVAKPAAPAAITAPPAAPAPAGAPAPAAASAATTSPKPATTPKPAAAPAPAAAPVPAATPAPAVGSAAAPPAKALEPPASDSPSAANPRVTEPPMPGPTVAEKATPVKGAESEPASDAPRWTELRGTVKVIAGNWIVLRVDNGQLVLVDLSTVRGGAASLRPGAPIAVYGTPTEQKFQAMGIVPPDNRPPAKPATVPPRR